MSSAVAVSGPRPSVAAAVVKVIVCVKMSRRERAPLSSSLLVAANRADDEAVAAVADRRDETDEKASASFARERSKMVSAAADFMVVLV